MNKTVIAMAISTLCLMSVAQAAPKDNTWYLGGKMGWSNYQKGDVSDTLTNYDTDNDGVGVGVYGGYQLTSWLGFEGGYDYLDKMAYTSTLGDNDFKSQGVQLSAKLSYAFNPVVDLIGRVGGFAYQSDNNDDSVSGVSPLVAVGTEYAPNREWAARLEYQWISQIGDEEKIDFNPDNGLLSLGVSYRFGQEEPVVAPPPAPAPTPTPAPAPVTVTKEFNLSSDVLFDFGKSSLKPEGVTALDGLYDQIKTETPKDGTALVVGYTDRIGSDASNQVLSEQRAKTVADYLVGKGIPADKVSTQGRGEAEPVTGTQCDAIKAKKELIACLAPDRRVSISVTGTKEVTE
ncbi:MAG: porin OmpA [Aeromonadaceae bacterium]